MVSTLRNRTVNKLDKCRVGLAGLLPAPAVLLLDSMLHEAAAASFHWEEVLVPGIILIMLAGVAIYTYMQEKARNSGGASKWHR